MGSKLSNPRVHVVMVDGSEWDVQTSNPDLMAYERTAAKHKWPDFQTVPVTWMTFLAWSAGRRAGLIDAGMTWEVFSTTECAEVRSSDDSSAGTTVDPTEQAPDID